MFCFHKALTYLFSSLGLLSTVVTNAQDATPYKPGGYTGPINYVRTWEAVAPTSNAGDLHHQTGPDKARMTTQYLDGLGRPVQTVSKAVSPTGKDLVAPIIYDEFGREVRQYLPYVDASSNNGLFKATDPFSAQMGFYTAHLSGQEETDGATGRPWSYSKTVMEASPLSRPLETFAPGKSWVGSNAATSEGTRKSMKMRYEINTLMDAVRIWKVQDIFGSFGSYINPSGAEDRIYKAGELHKTITIDEGGNQVVEYKDKEGKVVLKKVQLSSSPGPDHSGWLCTYYIHDDLGQLRAVIQPRGVEELAKTTVNWNFANVPALLTEQCFRYEYDQRGRMIKKQVPGAVEVAMVYDSRDRLVMTQDGNLKDQGQWLVTMYDNLNRPLKTGLWNNGQNAAYHQSLAMPSTAPTTFVPYPFTSEPTSGWTLLSETHYDDYIGLPIGFSSSLISSGYGTYLDAPASAYPYPLTPSLSVKGLVTWSKVRVLGESAFLTTCTLYDNKERVIQVQSQNVSGEIDIITNQYSFSGQLLRSHVRQKVGGTQAQTFEIVNKNLYDAGGRLLEVRKIVISGSVTTGEKLLVKNEYDALGQLKKKTLGQKKDASGNYISEVLEEVDYDYNIHGWMLGQNRDFAKTEGQRNLPTKRFGFDLAYDKPTIKDGAGASIGGFTSAYNGNIAGSVWRSAGDHEIRKYAFSYDAVNRLLSAQFEQNTGGSSWSSAAVNFTVDNLSYDANGNIKSMDQKGLKLTGSEYVDRLMYDYYSNSNKLRKVTDGAAPSTLGDFKGGAHTGDDYGYDRNGNLVTDQNKKMGTVALPLVTSGGAISYNHLNLPKVITVSKEGGGLKGNITYVYDASGNKLKKVTKETIAAATYNGELMVTTTYLGGAVYESRQYTPAHTDQVNYANYENRLQFITHGEGRIRPKRDGNETLIGFSWDYYLQDHLGNVRMVLSEEVKKDIYPEVQFEDNTVASEQVHYETVDKNRTLRSGSTSGKAQLLRKSTGSIGAGKLLKVMVGDKLEAKVEYYTPNETTDNSGADGVNAILTNLLTLLNEGAAVPATLKNQGTIITNNLGSTGTAFSTVLTSKGQTSSTTSTLPKAYLNILFFDEQFRFVVENSEAIQITTKGSVQPLTRVMSQAIKAPKNGYVYIYLSNESNNLVYFDNFQVMHERGHILEETHYYPFGLTMQGISSKTIGGLENKKKYQQYELNSDFGLNIYESFYRSHDPQLGRFWQIDPRPTNSESLYAAMGNNPIVKADNLGDTTFRFNSNGVFLGIYDLDQKGNIGSVGSVKHYKDKDGKRIEQWIGENYFSFNDINHDLNSLWSLKVGEQGLLILSEENLNAMLDNSDIYSDEAQGLIDRLTFAGRESNAGKMDFSVKYFLASKNLSAGQDGYGGFVLLGNNKGVAYNLMDAGNFMWGYAMKELGHSYLMAVFASQSNEKGNDPLEDQKAIREGYFHQRSSNGKIMNPAFKNVPIVKDGKYKF